MKLDSCLIVKNEEKNLNRLINQLMIFSDNIYIVDTGSTDSTVDIIKSYAYTGKVHFGYFEWTHNFSEARNYSISLSKDADYIFWCDGDEELSEEFIDRLKVFINEEYSEDLSDIYMYGMTTKNVFSNTETLVYWRTGLFKARKGIKFSNPIHETIVTVGYTVDEERFKGHMLTNYYDKEVDEKYRNFDIFGHIQKTRPLTCREMYYSGIELLNAGYPVGAYLFMIECIKHPDWYTEVIDALYTFVNLYNEHESCRNVVSSSLTDIAQYMIDNRMFNKCVLAKFASTLCDYGHYELAIKCAEIAYNMDNPGYKQLLTGYYYDEIACLFTLVISYDRLKQLQTANMYNDKILEKDPNHENAIHNQKYFSEKLNEN